MLYIVLLFSWQWHMLSFNCICFDVVRFIKMNFLKFTILTTQNAIMNKHSTIYKCLIFTRYFRLLMRLFDIVADNFSSFVCHFHTPIDCVNYIHIHLRIFWVRFCFKNLNIVFCTNFFNQISLTSLQLESSILFL